MISSAMATRFAFGLILFANPILAATIGLSPPAGSPSGPTADMFEISPEIVSLDGDASRVLLSDPAQCGPGPCATERRQLPDPFIGLDRTNAERAVAAFDRELLELFQVGALQRSNIEGLFWQIGSSIVDR